MQQAGGVDPGIIGGEIQVEVEVAGGFADGEGGALFVSATLTATGRPADKG